MYIQEPFLKKTSFFLSFFGVEHPSITGLSG